MKRIITLLIFLLPIIAGAQNDSLYRNVSVAFQARDLAIMGELMEGNMETHRAAYVQVIVKFKNADPVATALVTIDSISVDALLDVRKWMLDCPFWLSREFFDRVDTRLKAIPGTPFLQAAIIKQDVDANDDYKKRVVEWSRRVRAKRK